MESSKRACTFTINKSSDDLESWPWRSIRTHSRKLRLEPRSKELLQCTLVEGLGASLLFWGAGARGRRERDHGQQEYMRDGSEDFRARNRGKTGPVQKRPMELKSPPGRSAQLLAASTDAHRNVREHKSNKFQNTARPHRARGWARSRTNWRWKAEALNEEGSCRDL
jgi:hypothetical protein